MVIECEGLNEAPSRRGKLCEKETKAGRAINAHVRGPIDHVAGA